MIVWVLIIAMGGQNYGFDSSPFVIDNIATAESCDRLAVVVRRVEGVRAAVCAPVRKVAVR